MLIASATQKMIEFYRGSCHDINHFLKVWAFAKTIGELEGLDRHTQTVLELTAVVHDIACPLCREKYGNTDGKNQERESPPLVEEFFRELPVAKEDVIRISWSTRTKAAIQSLPSAASGSGFSAPLRASGF